MKKLLFLLFIFCFAHNDLCKSVCDLQYQTSPKQKLCSNYKQDIQLPFAPESTYCYFNCNITALYPGSCKCPNFCFEEFGQGKCTRDGCVCSNGFQGKDCSQKLNSKIETNPLKPLPFGNPFGSPFDKNDPYKDFHPVFNISVLAEIHVTLDEKDLLNLIYPGTIYQLDYAKCTMIFKNEIINRKLENVGIRTKGTLSRTQKKKGWKFDLSDLTEDFYGIKIFSVKGQQEHLSGIQSYTTTELLRAFGLGAQRSSFTKFYVNGVYYGLYWLHEDFEYEFFKARNRRVGPFYKCGSGLAALDYRGDDPNIYRNLFVHKPYLNLDDYFYNKKLIDRKDYTSLANLIKVINQTPDDEFEHAIDEVFDVEKFLKHLIVEISIMNHDTYTVWNNNYLLYEDVDTGKMKYISHDFDFSYFGDFRFKDYNIFEWNNITLRELGADKPKFCPLTTRILKIKRFKRNFIELFKEFLSKIYGNPLIKRLNELEHLLSPHVEKDYFYKLDCLNDFRFHCPRDKTGWIIEIERLKVSISQRNLNSLKQLSNE